MPSDNKGKLGTFKDEYACSKQGTFDPIVEFTALRSKCYSIKTLSQLQSKKCKVLFLLISSLYNSEGLGSKKTFIR